MSNPYIPAKPLEEDTTPQNPYIKSKATALPEETAPGGLRPPAVARRGNGVPGLSGDSTSPEVVAGMETPLPTSGQPQLNIPVELPAPLGGVYSVPDTPFTQGLAGAAKKVNELPMDIAGGMADLGKRMFNSLTGNEPLTLEELREARTNGWFGPNMKAAGERFALAHASTNALDNETNLDNAIHQAILARAAGSEYHPFSFWNDLIAGPFKSVGSAAEATAQATTPFERGYGAASLAASAVMAEGIAHGITKLSTRAVFGKDLTIPTATEEATVSTVHAANVAQRDVLNEAVRSPVSNRAPLEQATNIRERLLTESEQNTTQAIIKAHNSLNPNGTAIIPGVGELGEAIRNAKTINPSVGVATFARDDGLHDVAVYGTDSPLVDNNLRSQFEREGFFRSQIVSVQGEPVVYDGISEGGAVRVKDMVSGEDRFTSPEMVRRPPYVRSDVLETGTKVGIAKAGEDLYDNFKQHLTNTQGLPRSWNDAISSFAKSNSYAPDQIPALSQHLAFQAAKEARETYLTPDELSHFNQVAANLSKELGRDATLFETTDDYLQRGEPLPIHLDAATNGYRVDYSPSGQIVLRDLQNTELARAYSEDTIRKFINDSGQKEGVELDNGGNSVGVPPAAIGGAAMPPSSPIPPATLSPEDGLSSHWQARPAGWAGRILDNFRATFPWDATREAHFESVDNKWGSSFTQRIFRPLDSAMAAVKAKMRPWVARLDAISKTMAGMSSEQFNNITRYRETMSAEEVKDGYFKTRGLNEIESSIGEEIAARKVDTSKALYFSRQAADIRDGFKDQPEVVAGELNKLKVAMNMSDDDIKVAGTYDWLRTQPIETHHIGAITRYADALMSNAPTRGEFAQMTKMNSAQLVAARMLDTFYDLAGKTAGIPDEGMLSRYSFHVRAQSEVPSVESAFLQQRGLTKDMDSRFLADMVRTGEMNVYEMNPLIAAQRYISSALKAQEFVPAWNEAMKALPQEVAKLPPEARVAMDEDARRYVADLRGFPANADRLMQAGVSNLADQFKLNWTPNVRRDIINGMTSLFGSSLIDFRPALALKHLSQLMTMPGARFGFGVIGKGIAKITDGRIYEELKNSGVIPNFTPQSLVTPVDEGVAVPRVLQAARTALNKVRQAGVTMTGLKSVYEHSYGAVYLGVRDLALDELNKVAFGKQAKEAAYSKLFLNSYAPSFARDFDGLVSTNRVAEAADMIGRRAADETIFNYGNANSPKGWNTNVGRMLTMFGIWPTYAQEYLSNMMTRGTVAERARFVSRFASAQGAVWLAGRATGINLAGATVAHSFFWSGSPQVQLLQTAITAARGQGAEQRLARARLARLLPSAQNPGSMLIPGSNAVGDWVHAFGLLTDPWHRYSPLQAAARAIGFPEIRDHSWVDDYLPLLH